LSGAKRREHRVKKRKRRVGKNMREESRKIVSGYIREESRKIVSEHSREVFREDTRDFTHETGDHCNVIDYKDEMIKNDRKAKQSDCGAGTMT
jgi:hypothetical protein